MIKIFHSNGDTNYSNWIPNSEAVTTIEEADLVLFTGGEDVSPEYYDDVKHHTTYSNRSRDIKEIDMFDKAILLKKPILGVCRGSQLCCVMAGGKLIQDQNNPGLIHNMKTYDGFEIPVTSTHHQAQYPFNLPDEDYDIIGWSENLIHYRKSGDDSELQTDIDCEVVHYPKIKALAIQPHPEMLINYNGSIDREYRESVQWFRNMLNLKLGI